MTPEWNPGYRRSERPHGSAKIVIMNLAGSKKANAIKGALGQIKSAQERAESARELAKKRARRVERIASTLQQMSPARRKQLLRFMSIQQKSAIAAAINKLERQADERPPEAPRVQSDS